MFAAAHDAQAHSRGVKTPPHVQPHFCNRHGQRQECVTITFHARLFVSTLQARHQGRHLRSEEEGVVGAGAVQL